MAQILKAIFYVSSLAVAVALVLALAVVVVVVVVVVVSGSGSGSGILSRRDYYLFVLDTKSN